MFIFRSGQTLTLLTRQHIWNTELHYSFQCERCTMVHMLATLDQSWQTDDCNNKKWPLLGTTSDWFVRWGGHRASTVLKWRHNGWPRLRCQTWLVVDSQEENWLGLLGKHCLWSIPKQSMPFIPWMYNSYYLHEMTELWSSHIVHNFIT